MALNDIVDLLYKLSLGRDAEVHNKLIYHKQATALFSGSIGWGFQITAADNTRAGLGLVADGFTNPTMQLFASEPTFSRAALLNFGTLADAAVDLASVDGLANIHLTMEQVGALFGPTLSMHVETSGGAFNDFDMSAGLIRMLHNGTEFLSTFASSSTLNETTLGLSYFDGLNQVFGVVVRDPGTGILSIP